MKKGGAGVAAAQGAAAGAAARAASASLPSSLQGTRAGQAPGWAGGSEGVGGAEGAQGEHELHGPEGGLEQCGLDVQGEGKLSPQALNGSFASDEVSDPSE